MLTTKLIHSKDLHEETAHDILVLCNRAYGKELSKYFSLLSNGTHILGFVDAELASHAMWVERTLVYNEKTPLKTAYIELVATESRHRNKGYASRLMKILAKEICAYDIAALSPNSYSFYERLGWSLWQGNLFVRQGDLIKPGLGDEELMVLELPKTPPIDYGLPLSIEWREGEVW